ncbi:hypothetical protein QE361_003685 [Sphingomonas sp. SORGH_AS802]|uniref:hypothetical protein n=1 Tax=unclassified Sphingomonas TaxID=196159 RepID=UPI00286337D8|nr:MULTISPECIES: hypothetical protein [unclassified Sphingomonas]MDR6126575.1 hypothetical protein [Sphingomonas sp. SORGH_AS_0438]MDR6136677.1 hypothetical protein [Sphingomonas sp. SORGH_AS_0802]
MLILSVALLLASADKPAFPEKVPGMIEECLTSAIAAGDVTDTDESHKYICAGDAAKQLWDFLETERLSSYEQDTPQGRWLGREFPLGGCFKRVKMPDGQAASGGLSCTIWVPRPGVNAPNAQR